MAKKKSAVPRPRANVPLLGRDAEQRLLARAMEAGTLPQALLLTGNPGIGKARLAGWIAAALVCQAPRDGSPCQMCHACHLAAGMNHPDVHWIFPHTSPGGGEIDRQIAAVDEMIAKQLETRRSDALHPGPGPEDTYYLATIQWLRRHVSRMPSMGVRRVFVMTDADLLMTGDDSASPAANAFLKTLEEPPVGTYFLLTSALPHRLPATIRSRVAPFRMSPLSPAAMLAVFDAAFDDRPAGADEAVRYASGALRSARLRLEPEWQALRQNAVRLAELALGSDPVARHVAVRGQGFKGARTEFAALLAEIEGVAIEAAEAASGSAGEVAPEIRELVSRGGYSAEAWLDVAFRAAKGLRLALANVSPMLALHTVLSPAGATEGLSVL